MSISNNFAFLIGHNTLRLAAGVSGGHPTDEQLRRMQDFVREALDAGALGLSSGVEFEPGLPCSTDELISLAKVAGDYDGCYASHMQLRRILVGCRRRNF